MPEWKNKLLHTEFGSYPTLWINSYHNWFRTQRLDPLEIPNAPLYFVDHRSEAENNFFVNLKVAVEHGLCCPLGYTPNHGVVMKNVSV